MTLQEMQKLGQRDKLKIFKGLTVKAMRLLLKPVGIKGLYKLNKDALEELVLDYITDPNTQMTIGDVVEVVEDIVEVVKATPVSNQLLLMPPVETVGFILDAPIPHVEVSDDLEVETDMIIDIVTNTDYLKKDTLDRLFDEEDLTQKLPSYSVEVATTIYRNIIKKIHPDIRADKYNFIDSELFSNIREVLQRYVYDVGIYLSDEIPF